MPEATDRDPRVDPEAVVASIKADVARRRAAGEYPEALLRRLDEEFAPASVAPPLESLAHLQTVRPLESTRRLGSGASVFAKRAVRRAIAWYVRPVADDQTRFNFSVVRRLRQLEDRIAALEEELRRRDRG